MPLEGYYRTGDDAEQIRTVTRVAVESALIEILQAKGIAVGGDGVELARSMELASSRLREGKAFVLLTMRPLRTERCQVRHPDTGAAHSGRKLLWSYFMAASWGKVGGRIPSEVRKTDDDELNNSIWFGFESRYAYFRSTLHFYDLTVGISDEQRENSKISNLLLLQFNNYIRMPEDEFIEE